MLAKEIFHWIYRESFSRQSFPTTYDSKLCKAKGKISLILQRLDQSKSLSYLPFVTNPTYYFSSIELYLSAISP